MPDLTESIAVQAAAEAVYALVADLPRMAEWSPECTRVTWTSATPTANPTVDSAADPAVDSGVDSGVDPGVSPAGGPVVGARFVGHNRVGVVRWFTFGRVVAAEPGRRFAFEITFGPIPISLWAYDFAPTPDGCEVTESWTDQRPRALTYLFRPLFGNRAPRNVHGIHTTLTRLKTTAERE